MIDTEIILLNSENGLLPFQQGMQDIAIVRLHLHQKHELLMQATRTEKREVKMKFSLFQYSHDKGTTKNNEGREHKFL